MDEFDEFEELSGAEVASKYAADIGDWDKTAEYIRNHFEGDEYDEGDIIPISTRNQDLEGQEFDDVKYVRRKVELDDGLTLEGVFPEFGSNHHVELGDEAKEMTLYRQFSGCKEDFQEHMYDSPEKLEGITFGDMEKLDYDTTPERYTWHHNPEVGEYDLVKRETHQKYGHTGGNALWGDK